MQTAKNHQMNIARKTMKLSCVGARIMGGMDHIDAAQVLSRKTDSDCTCFQSRQYKTLNQEALRAIVTDDTYNVLSLV